MGKINRANIKKAIYYLKRNGILNTWYAARERMEEAQKEPYHYVPPTEEELEKQRMTPTEFQGVISIVVPTYRTAEAYLRDLIDSVRGQTYPHWELILADASGDDSVECVAASYADERIRYVRLAENAGIAQNTNCALEHVTGEYVGLLDHDDVLTADALYQMASRIGNSTKLLYSDEDKCNSDRTEYYEPHLKEDFNLDLLLSNNYICHFTVMERTLIQKLGFRPEYNGAQDYDLVLRAVELLLEEEEQIVHIPKVLYHWRCHSGSTAENPRSKQYAYEAGKRAVQDFADRQGWKARAEHLKHLGFYELQYSAPVLQSRRDLGAVGGRILKNGKIAGGRMSEEGQIFYEGLSAAYSGYVHRAVLPQDAEALDIRCIKVREECIPIFEEITGVPYRENADTGLFDVSALPVGADGRRLSIALGRALRKAGYRLLYQPSVTVKGKRTASKNNVES